MKLRRCLKAVGRSLSPSNAFHKLKRITRKRSFDRIVFDATAFGDVLGFMRSKGEKTSLYDSQTSLDTDFDLVPVRRSRLDDRARVGAGVREEIIPDVIHVEVEPTITYEYQTDNGAPLEKIRFAPRDSLRYESHKLENVAHFQHPWGPHADDSRASNSNKPETVLELHQVLVRRSSHAFANAAISVHSYVGERAIWPTGSEFPPHDTHTSWLDLNESSEDLLDYPAFDPDPDLDPEPASTALGTGKNDNDSEMEELLEEMLLDCMASLPLQALPLGAPEEPDPITMYSLRLSPIYPLVLETRPCSPDTIAIDDNSEVYVDHSPTSRPLSLMVNQVNRDGAPHPPPYLEVPSASQEQHSPDDESLSPLSDAPPPVYTGDNGIVDLIRMSATLLHRQTRPVIIKKALQIPRDAYTFSRLDKLDRLAHSWPDKDLSTADGIQLFKLALDDGTILCEFVRHLSPSSIKLPSYNPCTATKVANLRNFVGAYESSGIPWSGSGLRYQDFDNLSMEDLADYAKATISLYVLHGDLADSLYRFSDTRSRALDKSITSLAVGVASISGENPPNVSLCSLASNRSLASNPSELTSSCDRMASDSPEYDQLHTYAIEHCSSTGTPDSPPHHPKSYNALRLPEDEYLLYQQLLSIIRDEEKFKRVLLHGGAEVQSLLDLLQHLLTFPQIVGSTCRELLTVLVRLSTKSRLYPRSLVLMSDPQIDKEPVNCGHFGEILRGYDQNQGVCVKVVKFFRRSDSEKYLKSFIREIVIWGQLQHPNILPFYGVYHLGAPEGRICLVSPWMENGTLPEYLQSCPGADRLLLVHDITSALKYLHNKMIVHGDLKGNNILITLCGRACLADFGLSSVYDTEVIKYAALESTGHEGGTPRYEAPELLVDTDATIHRTAASDIYAFGCVCYEIFTGNVPFYEIHSTWTVMKKIFDGEMPTRPAEEVCSTAGLTDEVWSSITSCWSKLPQNRPSATDILSSALLSNLDDLRPEDHDIWTPSKYRSALYYATNNAPHSAARTIATCLE